MALSLLERCLNLLCLCLEVFCGCHVELLLVGIPFYFLGAGTEDGLAVPILVSIGAADARHVWIRAGNVTEV